MRQFLEENRMTLIVFLLILLFIIIFLAPRIFIFINAGQAGVLFKRFFGGVVTTNVYGEGFHIISPWNRMTIYNMRVQQLPIEYDVLTKNGLRVKVKLSIRFHPKYETVAVLHQRIGPQYVEKIVIPVAESSVRSIVGEKTAQDLFSLRSDIISAINNKAELGLNQNFIALDEILVRDVMLPLTIQDAIELKEVQRERYEAYTYILRREREETIRKEIEAFGWKNYNELVSQSLNPRVLRWMGIQATRELAESKNAKIVIMGSGSQGLPIILGSDITREEEKASAHREGTTDNFKVMEPMENLDERLKKLDTSLLNLWKFNNPQRSGSTKPGTGSTTALPASRQSRPPGSTATPPSTPSPPAPAPGTGPVDTTGTGAPPR